MTPPSTTTADASTFSCNGVAENVACAELHASFLALGTGDNPITLANFCGLDYGGKPVRDHCAVRCGACPPTTTHSPTSTTTTPLPFAGLLRCNADAPGWVDPHPGTIAVLCQTAACTNCHDTVEVLHAFIAACEGADYYDPDVSDQVQRLQCLDLPGGRDDDGRTGHLLGTLAGQYSNDPSACMGIARGLSSAFSRSQTATTGFIVPAPAFACEPHTEGRFRL